MEQQEIYSEEEEIIEEEEEEEIIEELVVEESYDEEYEEESVEEEVVVEEIIEEEVIEEEEVGTDDEKLSVGTFEETVAGEEHSIEEEDEAAIKQQFLIQEQAPAYEMAMDGDYDKLKGTLMLLKDQLEENGGTQQQLQRGITRYVDAVDEHGRSALHYACSQNSLQMAVLLLSPPFGADPNQPDGEGYPPLHVPCERGYVLMVQVLLKFGANADHRVFLEEDDDDDREEDIDDDPHYRGVPSVSTPLLAAIFLERTEVVKLLLEHGANPNVVTDTAQGKKSALELAAEIIHNPDMAALLRRHNAVAVPSCQPASPNKTSPNDHLPKWMKGF